MSKKHHPQKPVQTSIIITNHEVETIPFAVSTIADTEPSQSIQTHAYGLWEKAGRPEGVGAAEQFWLEAESEILTRQI